MCLAAFETGVLECPIVITSDMEYRRLPGAELDVSAVSLGTLGFVRANLTARAIAELVNRALDGGINLMDTAYVYANGEIEKAVGPVVEKRRDEVHVLTRCHFRALDGFKETFEGSFERLRTDYIDIFELHDVGTDAEYDKLVKGGVCDFVREAVEQGRVGCVGISTHGSRALMERIITSRRFKVVTLAYNLTGTKRSHADRESVTDTADVIMPLARECGCGVTVMKPFAGGTLLQPAPDGTQLTAGECLRYVLGNPHVSTVSPGLESAEQIDEALAAGRRGAELSADALRALEDKGRLWGQHFCRRCGYCLPCKEGIEIPGVMKILEYYRGAGDDETKQKSVRERYAALKVKASACAECGECEDRCPYELPIADRMKEAARVFEP